MTTLFERSALRASHAAPRAELHDRRDARARTRHRVRRPACSVCCAASCCVRCRTRSPINSSCSGRRITPRRSSTSRSRRSTSATIARSRTCSPTRPHGGVRRSISPTTPANRFASTRSRRRRICSRSSACVRSSAATSPIHPKLYGREAQTIISHRLWQSRFAGDRDVIGKVVHLNGYNYTVVGVMPPGFNYPGDTDLWQQLRWDLSQHTRFAHFMESVARLKPGVSRRARAARAGVAHRRDSAPRTRRRTAIGACASSRSIAKWPVSFVRRCSRCSARRDCCCSSRASTSPTSCWRARWRVGARSRCVRRSARVGRGCCGSFSPRASCSRRSARCSDSSSRSRV